MACENALGVGTNHAPPNNVTRLVRNIIMGSEFIMSHITHFYTLAALSYVQGPPIPPWTPYFDDNYYVPHLQYPDTPGRTNGLPELARLNVPELGVWNSTGAAADLADIWDNVVYEYVLALKHRRDAHNMAALLGGRTPQIQNGALVGGCSHVPSTADVAIIKNTIKGTGGTSGIEWFLENRMIPLTHIVSYLYGNQGQTTSGTGSIDTAGGRMYDNCGAVGSGYGAGDGATTTGARRVLAWGAFDTDNDGGDDPDRLFMRGCYEWNGTSSATGCMTSVIPATGMWAQVREYIDNSHYDNMPGSGHPRHPSSGYTKPNAATGYSWSKSPRIMDGATPKACQVGPLARMAVQGERNAGGTNQWDSYRIGSTKDQKITAHAALGPILNPGVGSNLATVVGAYGGVPGVSEGAGFKCGFSTMDRHRARAYEAMRIAKAITSNDGTGTGWADQLTAAINAGAVGYTSWNKATAFTGTKRGYGAHEAPRGALAHFVEVTNGRITNYQCVVPTTWNVNPKVGTTYGPIESAIIGTKVSGTTSSGHTVPVEVLRVVQGFDPCIACTVH